EEEKLLKLRAKLRSLEKVSKNVSIVSKALIDNEKGLIILAATNRPDILDPALLRPGRFDRQVPVERPDVKGREEILRIHSKNVKLENDVDFESLAHGTIGFAGADLANVVNEAALLAVRAGRTKVSMTDFNDAIDKVSIGLKKKSRRENEKERKLVAYHETGHALVGAFTPDYPPVNKITVVPRSHGIGGFTQYREEEEKTLQTKRDLLNEVDVLLGGRGAEQIIFGEVSTGAANDIQRATATIRKMITDYGMSDRFQNMVLGKSGHGYGTGEPQLVREYSEDTQKYIDDEIARIIAERYKAVLSLLKKHKDLLDYISNRLLEKETMDGKEFEEIIKAEKHAKELEHSAKSAKSSKKS
ncbi:MAG: AAA family ATPase, partial [Treponema sp.]|nr:AAA family ATPase [Treponema sp.]